jgi:hypothetical protein
MMFLRSGGGCVRLHHDALDDRSGDINRKADDCDAGVIASQKRWQTRTA